MTAAGECALCPLQYPKTLKLQYPTPTPALTALNPAGHCVLLQSRFEQPTVAARIIGGGPEPLQSQFAAGYSMALNLLHTRSLAEARQFLERSFGNYLGARRFRSLGF